jgi:hypothetical protein
LVKGKRFNACMSPKCAGRQPAARQEHARMASKKD